MGLGLRLCWCWCLCSCVADAQHTVLVPSTDLKVDRASACMITELRLQLRLELEPLSRLHHQKGRGHAALSSGVVGWGRVG